MQDPWFSKFDVQFLASLDFEIVNDPDAFSTIDAGSLVMHIGSMPYISRWMCDGTWPAAMFCSDWSESYVQHEEDYPRNWLKRVPAMFSHYRKEPCIEDKNLINRGPDWDDVFLFQRKF